MKTKTALIWYGTGGIVSFLGWFNLMWIYVGMGLLLGISVILTVTGDN